MRNLEEVSANCKRISDDNDEYAKFDCSAPLYPNKNYSSISMSDKFDFNGKPIDVTISLIAKQTMLNNIQDLTSTNLEKGITILNDTELEEQKGLNFKLKGNLTNGSIKDNQVFLSFTEINSGDFKNMTCQVNNIEKSIYQLDCSSKEPINCDLNGLTGYSDSGNYFFIKMKDGEQNKISLEKDKTNSFAFKKSSGGLSGGAIAGIILTCIAALAAVVVVALMLKKSKVPIPQDSSSGLNIN